MVEHPLINLKSSTRGRGRERGVLEAISCCFSHIDVSLPLSLPIPSPLSKINKHVLSSGIKFFLKESKHSRQHLNVTKNASICQNSHHQRETKSSNLEQWEMVFFFPQIRASSQCLGLSSIPWADPHTSRVLRTVFFQPDLKICDLTPSGGRRLAFLFREKAEIFQNVCTLPANQVAQLNPKES